MKIYLVKCKKTNEVIKWKGTLKTFMLEVMYQGMNGIKISDGERRSLAITRQRETYYKGFKVLFYGEEIPNDLLKDDMKFETYKGENIKRLEAQEKKNFKEMSLKVKSWLKPSKEHEPIVFYKQEMERICKDHEEGKTQTLEDMELYDSVFNPVKKNVLFIPDIHCPFDYAKGIEIAKKIYKEEECTEVVFLGDVVDFHTISEYGHSPDFMGQSEELIRAKKRLKAWHNAFPIAKVCTGNHTMRIKRKIEKAGLCSVWMNDFRTMFSLEGWNFQLYHELGKFIATHGMGQSAKARSKDLHKSVISGHLHSKFEANYYDGLWAIYGGCMVDIDSRAFEYGKFFKLPRLGFVVIKDIENNPQIKMIPIKYERNNDAEKMHELW